MKCVVDTSTILRDLTRRYSEPAYIVDQIKDRNSELLMTDEMAKELSIAIYLMCEGDTALNTKKYLRAISIFTLHATEVEKITKFTSCSDPEDAMLIECAIDGQAEYCIASAPSIFDIKNYCEDSTELALIKDLNFCHPQDFYNDYVRNNAKKIPSK
jgi:uncharacterized protein